MSVHTDIHPLLRTKLYKQTPTTLFELISTQSAK